MASLYRAEVMMLALSGEFLPFLCLHYEEGVCFRLIRHVLNPLFAIIVAGFFKLLLFPMPHL